MDHSQLNTVATVKVEQESIRVKGVTVQRNALRVGEQTFIVTGRFTKTAGLLGYKDEWLEDVLDPEEVIRTLRTAPLRIDLLRFRQRIPESEAKFQYYKEWRHIAAIRVSDYKSWFLKKISPKARNKIRKTEKYGVTIEESELNDELVRGIMKIFNQSPVRRGKRFWHYGKDFETVKKEMGFDLDQSIFITAYYEKELIGFIKLLLTARYAIITLILDKMNHREKAPMNGMVAKAVAICAARCIPHIVYTEWRRGEHGQFQESLAFEGIPIPEYFVPLTLRGTLVLWLKLHKGLRGWIPERMMVALLALRAKWYGFRYSQKLPLATDETSSLHYRAAS